MKDLTAKEFDEAPDLIQYTYTMCALKQPLGSSIIDEAIEKYPEYFPDEVEQQKKWASVPQQVKDAYFEEYQKLLEDIYKDVPHVGKGILFYATHPEEDAEHSKGWDEATKKGQPLLKALHDKYFGKYGIK